MKASERLADLMRQGLSTYQAAGKRPARPMVACEDCLDWHPMGLHTADALTRKGNREERGGK